MHAGGDLELDDICLAAGRGARLRGHKLARPNPFELVVLARGAFTAEPEGTGGDIRVGSRPATSGWELLAASAEGAHGPIRSPLDIVDVPGVGGRERAGGDVFLH